MRAGYPWRVFMHALCTMTLQGPSSRTAPAARRPLNAGSYASSNLHVIFCQCCNFHWIGSSHIAFMILQ